MSSHPAERPAVAAAASWFARLNSDNVSTADLKAFEAWRREAANDQAYREVERLWRRGEALRADPQIAALISAALAPSSPRPRWASLAPPLAAAVAAALIVALTGWSLWQGRVDLRTIRTVVGQSRTVPLADGSTLTLDTDSEVALRYAPGARRVRLQKGRAFFSVTHDASRPFLVDAGAAEVRAIGTRFSVRREPGDVRVVLVQGVVVVRGPASRTPLRLAAGQELTVGARPNGPHPVDVKAATSWLQDQLTFRDLPLAQAIVEVNRYSLKKVVLRAPEAADTPVSGVFHAGDLQAFAAAAADFCRLEVVTTANGDLLLQPPTRTAS